VVPLARVLLEGPLVSVPVDEVDVPNLKRPRPTRLTPEERKSLTHGDFWIPDDERAVYRRALEALNAAGVPFVVAGAYAIYEHTGIYRKTKDLDLFFVPTTVVAAARVLREAGFVMRLEESHWLAKATMGEYFVDLIYGMGNGVAFIDDEWIRHSKGGILAACQVQIAPPEELVWHRLFIGERHRHDMSDIVHLILAGGEVFDWERLLSRTGEHWPLLLSQILMFSYVYPAYRSNVPGWVIERLLERARAETGRDEGETDFTRGPLISKFSFTIDIREWGFNSPREELVRQARRVPEIVAICDAGVWDERAMEMPDGRHNGAGRESSD
jgi:hypothetical protein